jgi:hypothetical protein
MTYVQCRMEAILDFSPATQTPAHGWNTIAPVDGTQYAPPFITEGYTTIRTTFTASSSNE